MSSIVRPLGQFIGGWIQKDQKLPTTDPNQWASYNKQNQGMFNSMRANAQSGASDPDSVQDKWAAGFQESPEARNITNDAQNSLENMNAATGTIGSPQEQEALQQKAGQIASADQNNYLNRSQGIYNANNNTLQNLFGKSQQAQEFATRMGYNAAMNQFKNKYAGEGAMIGGASDAIGNASNSVSQALSQKKGGNMFADILKFL